MDDITLILLLLFKTKTLQGALKQFERNSSDTAALLNNHPISVVPSTLPFPYAFSPQVLVNDSNQKTVFSDSIMFHNIMNCYFNDGKRRAIHSNTSAATSVARVDKSGPTWDMPA